MYVRPKAKASTRPALDHVLSGRAFSIDSLACAAGAQILRKMRVDPGALHRVRSPESELLYRVALTAICHQINWDFLSERLAGVFDEEFNVYHLSTITSRDV